MDINQLIDNFKNSCLFNFFDNRDFKRTEEFDNIIERIINTNESFLIHGNRQTYKTTTAILGIVLYALNNPNSKILIAPYNEDNIKSIIRAVLSFQPYSNSFDRIFKFENGSRIEVVDEHILENIVNSDTEIDILFSDEFTINNLLDLSPINRIIGTVYFPTPPKKKKQLK